jgi:hypothetical protein
VFVGLGIQHAMRMRQVVIYGLPRSTILFHIISLVAQLYKKVIDHKICVLILSTTFVRNISHSMKNLAKYDKKCT